jgi:NADPH2:quinone reductase
LTSTWIEVRDWGGHHREADVRVVEVAAFGGPEVLEVKTVADPVAGPGQVVVEVAVAGVLSVDAVIRRGHGGDYFPVRPPYVPGAGVAGVVQSVGEGVDHSWIGRRVVVGVGNGGYASHALAAVDGLIPVPDELGLPEAMALLHDGSTAVALLEATPVQPGETVLVQPAVGGLGILLVQLLYTRGIRVVGAARGEKKLALVKEFGADVVVDYASPDWTDQVGVVDVAFDGVGGELGRAAFGAVRDGGRFSNYGNASGTPAAVSPERGVTVKGMEQLMGFGAEVRRRVEYLLAEAAARRVRPVIGATYPLEQAAEAHVALESRINLGKTLLVP